MTTQRARPNSTEIAAHHVTVTPRLADNFENNLASQLDPAAARVGTTTGQTLSAQTNQAAAQGAQSLPDRAIPKAALLGAAAAAGLAIGKKLADAFGTATEIADLPKTFTAQLGSTPAEAQALAATAGELYTQGWGDSLGDVAASVSAVVGEIGDVTEDQLLELMPRFIGIAEQSGVEVAQVADAVNKLVVGGLVADVNEGADLVAAAFQRFGQGSGEDVLDTIREYSVQFEAAGLSGQLALGLIDQMVKAGARNTDFAADSLKEFVIRTKDGSKATIEAYELMGLNAEEMTAKMARGGDDAAQGMREIFDAMKQLDDQTALNAVSVSLFGTKAEDLGGSLHAMDLDTAAAAFGDVGGAADEMADATLKVGDRIGALNRELTVAIAEALVPMLPLIEDIAGGIGWFFGILRDNPAITTALFGVAGALGAVAAAQWILNSAVLANPMTWIIGAAVLTVGLLIAAITTVITKWESFVWLIERTKEALDSFWGDVGKNFEGAMNFAGNLLGGGPSTPDRSRSGGGGGTIPALAHGGTILDNGPVLVGETGQAEVLFNQKGASVVPLPYLSDLMQPQQLPASDGTTRAPIVNIYNPVAEKASHSLARNRREVGADLVLG